MERIILRMYSACWVCRSPKLSWPNLGDPVDDIGHFLAEIIFQIVPGVAAESSTVSCSRPALTVAAPRPIWARK